MSTWWQEMRKHALWRDETPGEWEETREGVEKFILRKLHPHLFAPHEAEDLRRQDEGLHARLAALAFLGPAHLDIKSVRSAGCGMGKKAKWHTQTLYICVNVFF